VLEADTPFEAVRQRAEVLASIRNGECLFKRPESSFEIELDLFLERPAGLTPLPDAMAEKGNLVHFGSTHWT
jgi:hypothetical protein